jgi:hypothetical protein
MEGAASVDDAVPTIPAATKTAIRQKAFEKPVLAEKQILPVSDSRPVEIA